MPAAGLPPARPKIYDFAVIVADFRIWLLDVIGRTWLRARRCTIDGRLLKSFFLG